MPEFQSAHDQSFDNNKRPNFNSDHNDSDNQTQAAYQSADTTLQQEDTGPQHKKPASPKKSSFLKTLYTYLLIGAAFLLPLVIIPFTSNLITDSKLFLIILLTLLTTGIFFLNSFKDKAWKLIITPLTLPLTLFALVTLASTFLTQNYPVGNLLSIGSAYLALWFVVVLGSSLIDEKKSDLLAKIITTAAIILSITGVLQLLGYGPTQLIARVLQIDIQNNFAFTLAGSTLVAAEIIGLALLAQAATVIKNKTVKTFDVIAIPILLFGLGLHVYMMLPNRPAAIDFPPLAASWSVALDSVRVPKSALIGQGPDAYSSAFSKYKPAQLNLRRDWRTNFGSAPGAPLTMMVQLGFLGLIAWLLFFSQFFNFVRKNKKEVFFSPLTWMLIASFIIQLVLPPSYVLLGLQAIILAFWIAQNKNEFAVLKLNPLNASIDQPPVSSVDRSKADKAAALVVNGLVLAVIVLLFYLTGRAYAAYNQSFLADKARMNNKAVEVYEHQRRAKLLNPYSDQIRRAYAQTNLQIAIALSNKTDITDQEKQQVGQLVQQAVTEARAAATINPNNLNNWLVLAQVYEQLAGSVEGADQWAVNTYIKAIQQAPSDPLLRISLGNILFNNNQLVEAANLYNQAINLKPNLATAYFHLGLAQQQAENYTGAKKTWERALELLNEGSQDQEQLQKLIGQLDQKIEEQKAAAQAQQAQTEAAQESAEDEQAKEQQESPLSDELPSLTDQNLERGENAVSSADDEPLDFSEETEETVNQEADTQTQEDDQEALQPQATPTQTEPTPTETQQQ